MIHIPYWYSPRQTGIIVGHGTINPFKNGPHTILVFPQTDRDHSRIWYHKSLKRWSSILVFPQTDLDHSRIWYHKSLKRWSMYHIGTLIAFDRWPQLYGPLGPQGLGPEGFGSSASRGTIPQYERWSNSVQTDYIGAILGLYRGYKWSLLKGY